MYNLPFTIYDLQFITDDCFVAVAKVLLLLILPELKMNKNVLVSAHGNSLRSIVMRLENIDESSIVKLEIPTGVPRIYLFENDTFILQE